MNSIVIGFVIAYGLHGLQLTTLLKKFERMCRTEHRNRVNQFDGYSKKVTATTLNRQKSKSWTSGCRVYVS